MIRRDGQLDDVFIAALLVFDVNLGKKFNAVQFMKPNNSAPCLCFWRVILGVQTAGGIKDAFDKGASLSARG
jgi:hypothetical protein